MRKQKGINTAAWFSQTSFHNHTPEPKPQPKPATVPVERWERAKVDYGLRAQPGGEMICPGCDAEETLQTKAGCWVEPHGETHYDEWWNCSACGGDFSGDEVSEANKETSDAV